jgi:hypothetical protein
LEIDCSDPDAAVSVLRAAGRFREVSLYGALIHVVTPEAAVLEAEIRRLLQEQQIEIRHLASIAPSLEDVFIASAREEGTRRD